MRTCFMLSRYECTYIATLTRTLAYLHTRNDMLVGSCGGSGDGRGVGSAVGSGGSGGAAAISGPR